ncbi:8066_t:CDS:1 [Scutellospora calospora]|uniref:8066_t:CDS:1 n=1 Tax=Scutellospora calospora TaxID=85575 RepID=A0ACA9JUK0_9GLOM|nr:8066_t:CDS:1 [Scutellospora calospora]
MTNLVFTTPELLILIGDYIELVKNSTYFHLMLVSTFWCTIFVKRLWENLYRDLSYKHYKLLLKFMIQCMESYSNKNIQPPTFRYLSFIKALTISKTLSDSLIECICKQYGVLKHIKYFHELPSDTLGIFKSRISADTFITLNLRLCEYSDKLPFDGTTKIRDLSILYNATTYDIEKLFSHVIKLTLKDAYNIRTFDFKEFKCLKFLTVI